MLLLIYLITHFISLLHYDVSPTRMQTTFTTFFSTFCTFPDHIGNKMLGKLEYSKIFHLP